jgi:hypothetical protein
VLKWVGKGDADRAVAAVKPEHRTQRDPEVQTTLAPDVARAFDDLYAAVEDATLLRQPALLRRLGELNNRLLPELTELQTRVLQSEMERARALGEPRKPAPVAGLPARLPGFD